jgi:UDP-glucose-4-epimerase GalE
MTVLVTGGAGYIGSHTVRRLRALGRDVVVLDTLERGRKDAVLDAPLVVGDISDQDLVMQLVVDHGVDSCIHFAAYKAVGESMEQPGRYFANNVTGAERLVDALNRRGVEQVVFSSSCSVYGTPAEVPVRETAPLHPESVYAETKRMTEDILRWYSATKGLRSVSLRYFNAAGASLDNVIGEDWKYSLNLIPVVMKAALGRGPAIRIFGSDYPTPDGTAIRDYIHVDDLADAHARALDYLAEAGESIALNLGTGVGTSVLEVVKATEQIGQCTVPVEWSPRRAGDPVSVYADPTQVRDVLGWEPRHGLDTIIETAWRWHSTHLDGIEA